MMHKILKSTLLLIPLIIQINITAANRPRITVPKNISGIDSTTNSPIDWNIQDLKKNIRNIANDSNRYKFNNLEIVETNMPHIKRLIDIENKPKVPSTTPQSSTNKPQSEQKNEALKIQIKALEKQISVQKEKITNLENIEGNKRKKHVESALQEEKQAKEAQSKAEKANASELDISNAKKRTQQAQAELTQARQQEDQFMEQLQMQKNNLQEMQAGLVRLQEELHAPQKPAEVENNTDFLARQLADFRKRLHSRPINSDEDSDDDSDDESDED